MYSDSDHVVRYGPADIVLTAWTTGPGSFPRRLSVGPGPTGSQLYVSTWGSNGDPTQPPGLNDRVLVYNTGGALLGVLGTGGAGPGQLNNPSGVAVNPSNGFLYVLDNGNNRVQLRAPTGAPLDNWGSSGTGDGQFNSPSGIELAGGRIWVSDSSNNRVQSFDLNGNFLSKFAAGSPTDVAVEFTPPPPPTITSTPPTEATVGQKYTYAAGATGSQPITWNLLSPPPGMTVNSATGLVQWTPTAAGGFGVTLGASNAGGSATQTWTISVAPPAATITVRKDTVPDDARDFDFLHDFAGATATFTLDDDGTGGVPSSMTFPVQPGTYTVTEAHADGFVLTGIDCGDAVFTRNLADGAAEDIEVSAGDAITCTFTNERDRDGDGIPDGRDACPDVPGVAPSGCPAKPDLVVSKTNDRGGSVAVGGSWVWTLEVRNVAAVPAVFPGAAVLLLDQLPARGLRYGSARVVEVGAIFEPFECDVLSDVLGLNPRLSCFSRGRLVILPDAYFRV
ncbi:MAG: prealbumin-like fold domain-containing protein, partial [Nocardioidaceae bacterium]